MKIVIAFTFLFTIALHTFCENKKIVMLPISFSANSVDILMSIQDNFSIWEVEDDVFPEFSYYKFSITDDKNTIKTSSVSKINSEKIIDLFVASQLILPAMIDTKQNITTNDKAISLNGKKIVDITDIIDYLKMLNLGSIGPGGLTITSLYKFNSDFSLLGIRLTFSASDYYLILPINNNIVYSMFYKSPTSGIRY